MELSREQTQTIAAGLYHLAAVDGVHEDEVAMIRAFLVEVGEPELADRLPELTFDPVEAYAVLESSWLRTLFLRAAVRLIEADRDVTPAEADTLDWMARVFGIEGGLAALRKGAETS